MSASDGITILLVEDRPADADLVKRLLVEHRADLEIRDVDHATDIDTIEHADCLADGIDAIDSGKIDLILLDLDLPDSEGLETVSAMNNAASNIPIIVLTGQKGVGVTAIQRGAQDYLVKGQISADSLIRTIAYAMERARITRELQDQNHRLTLINEILRTDLRNDMSMIIGWGDQLQNQVPTDNQAVVKKLLDASRHALTLTDTAAELIEILSDPETIDAQPSELRSILYAEIDRCRQNATVDLTVDWQLEDESVQVVGTPLLGSVFEQLLQNAVIHTDRQEPTVNVTVEEAGETVSVTISDDGIGMSETQQNRIAGSDLTAGGSVGTGLYLVTTVLENIGGTLNIGDNHPRGTVVTVRLDLVDR